MRLVEQVEQQGRGDVIRQVADDAQFAVRRCEGTEVELECIGAVNRHRLWQRFAQTRNEVTVYLYNIQTRDFTDQFAREHAFAGADLDDVIRRLGIESRDDVLDDPALVQEVLAEALTWTMRTHKI